MSAIHKCEGTVTLKVGQRQMGRSTNHWVKRTNNKLNSDKKRSKESLGFQDECSRRQEKGDLFAV